MQRIQYAWLTSPVTTGRFLGRDDWQHVPFLMRHGVVTLERPFLGSSLSDWADYIRTGGCHFYISAVEPDGKRMDLTRAFYMVRSRHNAIVVGPKLFHSIDRCCDLNGGYVIPLNPRYVSAHAFPYSFPKMSEADSFYRQILVDLGLNDMPSEDDLMRLLTMYSPVSISLPQMYLILSPIILKHTGVLKEHRGDQIVISLGESAPVKAPPRPAGLRAHRMQMSWGDDAWVRTRDGDVPASSALFTRLPILAFDGFLIPPSIAPLFGLGNDCEWPHIHCIKDVAIEW